jgi:ferredoxin-NADP reductase
VEARLHSRRWLSPTVLQVLLAPASPFRCRAGQFLTLVLPDADLARSYSIASTAEGLIELHVRVLPEGRMSQRLASGLVDGAGFMLAGPSGSCTYDDIDPDRRLVLAGTGTGLAPLWAVLNDALSQGHRGEILLYHGARDEGGFYLVEALQALQALHPGFRYVPTLTDLAELVASNEAAPADTEFFLCGDATLVNKLKRRLFLAGAKLDRLHTDPFVPAQPPSRG